MHPTQRTPGVHPNPGTSQPKSRHPLLKFKTTEKGALHKVYVRDLPGPGSGISRRGSLMSQEHPAQELYLLVGFLSLEICFSEGSSGPLRGSHGGLWGFTRFAKAFPQDDLICQTFGLQRVAFHENDRITTKTTKTTQTAAIKSRGLRTGSAEITETTEITRTTRIWGADNGFPKNRNKKQGFQRSGCWRNANNYGRECWW